jgi:hypothetical protein
MLNDLKCCDENMRTSLGVERSDPSEYTAVKIHHIEAIVKALKSAFGSTTEELFTDQVKESPFGGGPRPWNKVRNPDNLPGGANLTSQELEERNISWIISQLESTPFGH